MAALLHAVRDALYPPACAVCRAGTAAPGALCAACWVEVEFLAGPLCHCCGRPVLDTGPEEERICDACLYHPHEWTSGRAVLAYRDVGRTLVLSLKHGDRLDLVPMLAGWMKRAGGPLVTEADLIVPVPLHWTRLFKRRANQSAELARHLAAQAGKSGAYAPGILRRSRRTPSQEGKSRDERVANVAGALTARHRVDNRRVLLIDDVLTTGATLDAAARVLLGAGAARVDILVVALAMGGEGAYVPDLADEEDPDGDG